ncbi:bifunctional Manganese-iron superoxide dismutase [Babesia duncani]|uniref:Superoxide dismutase [Fe] n=1 Tax=Babesia duncani TaxID=323732 RepID=A0AAD9UQ26_9APIC|nr:bifunctional Manganese-iron superoxide dismutase [Babesia duncani]
MKDLIPHICEETLSFHYGKHHAGYVAKLNGLIKGTPLENKSVEGSFSTMRCMHAELILSENGAVFNNAAQIWNHTFYWHSMKPNGGGEPSGPIRQKIEEKFGSFDKFKQDFTALLAGHFGSGWGWLVLKDDGTADIVQTHDAGSPLRDKLGRPLLVCDVWEHAYYIDYRNDRAKYINAFCALLRDTHESQRCCQRAIQTCAVSKPTESKDGAFGKNSSSFPYDEKLVKKLGKRRLKRIQSIQRLYRPILTEEGFTNAKEVIPVVHAVPCVAPQINEENYSLLCHFIKDVYKSATGGVYCKHLWKRFSQKALIVAPRLHAQDLCMLFYCFGKIGYKDKRLLNVISPLLIRNIGLLSCGGTFDECKCMLGISLILNALKRLEVLKGDLIELLVNRRQFRNSQMLKKLASKIRPAIEANELDQKFLALSLHAFCKLDFDAPQFFSAWMQYFETLIQTRPDCIDAHSLVLVLHAGVCVLKTMTPEMTESIFKCLENKLNLGNYKAIKLKHVLENLRHRHPGLIDSWDSNLKALVAKIDDYRLAGMPKRFPRWAFEVSLILKENQVEHKRNVLFRYVYGDVYLPEHKIVIKCCGPYSFYTSSIRLTTAAKVDIETLELMGYRVCMLPYYEWNVLKTQEEKRRYLSRFGREMASRLFETC